MDYEGFEVKIMRQGDHNVAARKRSIYLDLQLDIRIEKPSGQFTLEANGTILNVTVTANITNELNPSIKTDIDVSK